MAEGGLLDEPLARELLQVAADGGVDLRAALAEGDDALRPTEVAQPALLLVEAVLAGALSADVDVVAVAGHSVGEYAACVAAGALRPDAAMRLVVERGRLMAAMHEGTMSALLGMDADAATAVCDEVQRDSGETVVVANVNAPGQTVISGTVAGIDAAVALAQSRGLRRAVRLNVSGAFHSPLMAAAADAFARVLDSVELSPARVPVVCNVDGQAVSDPDALRDRLRRQLTSPVCWIDCVERMVSLGAATLVEVGPGSVLGGLARRIAPDVTAVSSSSLDAVRELSRSMAAA